MCIFCKIVSQEIPAKIIAENDLALAFLDIKPVNPGHSLVIIKKHLATIEELNLTELSKVMELVKIIGQRVKDRLKVKGYNLILNNDKVAGQEIKHLHFHLIPRLANDKLKLWPQGEYQVGEADNIWNKLK